MSRTVRRKNAQHEYSWVLSEWVDYVRLPIPRASAEGRKKLARFHSDHAHVMDHMGPRWFRDVTTHRPDRRAANEDIHRWVATGMDPDGDWNPNMSRTYRHSGFFDYWD